MPALILIAPVLACLWDRGANHRPPVSLVPPPAAVLYLEFDKPYPETITLISTEVKP